jgi:uncharacterized protein (UPF0305 family)
MREGITMLKKLLAIFAFFKKESAKYSKLSHAEKIAYTQGKVNAALTVFVDTYESVQQAQESLAEVIAEAEQDFERIKQTIEEAKKEFTMNEEVQMKIAAFVPGVSVKEEK